MKFSRVYNAVKHDYFNVDVVMLREHDRRARWLNSYAFMP